VEGPGLSLRQRIGWGAAFVFGRYAWGRLESVATACHWGDQGQASLAYRLPPPPFNFPLRDLHV